MDAEPVIVSWQDRLFNLLFWWQPSLSKCTWEPLTLKSERTHGNWKCRQSPPPFIFGVRSPKIWGRLELCNCQGRSLSSFLFHLSIILSYLFSVFTWYAPLFLPLHLSSSVFMSTVCLSFTHAVHTTLSQSIHWNRAQTVDWDITHSLERWSGWRRKRETLKCTTSSQSVQGTRLRVYAGLLPQHKRQESRQRPRDKYET